MEDCFAFRSTFAPPAGILWGLSPEILFLPYEILFLPYEGSPPDCSDGLALSDAARCRVYVDATSRRVTELGLLTTARESYLTEMSDDRAKSSLKNNLNTL